MFLFQYIFFLFLWPLNLYWTGSLCIYFFVFHHPAVLLLRPQMALFATPELIRSSGCFQAWTWSFSCAAHVLLWRWSGADGRSTTAATLHHWLNEELFTADVMDSGSSWFIDRSPVLSFEVTDPIQISAQLWRSEHLFWSTSGSGSDLLFEPRAVKTTESVRHSCIECGHLCLSRTFSIHHRGRRGLRKRGEGLTDGLSEWIIDRGLRTDAGSINSSKPVWWITADKHAE